VTGSVPIAYQWFSNSVAIGKATNSVYTPSASLLTNGAISLNCQVSNPAGVTTSMVWSVALVPAPTASYPRAVLALNPIAYWRLNEANQVGGNNGVVAWDYAGGNNGVYTNVVLSQPGYNAATDSAETSALFGSLSTVNCAVGQIAGPDFATPSGSNAEFTISAWVNGDGYTRSANAGIVTKGYFYGEELTMDEGAPGSDLRFVARSAAGTAYTANSTINLYTSGGWHHLVGVCDEANGNLLLYIDGALAGSAAIPALSGLTNSLTTPLCIGARATSAATGNNHQFFGMINDVAIFNYALNSNQVQGLHTSGVTLPPAGLSITTLNAGQMQLNWNYGVLQTATNVFGPYSDMTNVVQPYTVPATNPQQYYRVREN
jgi:hypothetical protein